MDFNQYQREARTTAVYKDAVVYPTLGLAGEAGEVCEKIKKLLRDGDGVESIPEEKLKEISKELGDVLWYISNLASDLKLNLGAIAVQNLDKLYKRQAEGKIHGSGDNR